MKTSQCHKDDIVTAGWFPQMKIKHLKRGQGTWDKKMCLWVDKDWRKDDAYDRWTWMGKMARGRGVATDW